MLPNNLDRWKEEKAEQKRQNKEKSIENRAKLAKIMLQFTSAIVCHSIEMHLYDVIT